MPEFEAVREQYLEEIKALLKPDALHLQPAKAANSPIVFHDTYRVSRIIDNWYTHVRYNATDYLLKIAPEGIYLGVQLPDYDVKTIAQWEWDHPDTTPINISETIFQKCAR